MRKLALLAAIVALIAAAGFGGAGHGSTTNHGNHYGWTTHSFADGH